jgi:hypothetical protein
MARQASGDLVRRRYPTTATRVAAGLGPVFETERYLLLKVPARDPRRTRGAVAAGGGQVGGQARGSDATPSTGTAAP